MTERKWTPGPLTAAGYAVFDKAGNCIAMFDTDNASNRRYKANAHLFAAAHDLYEANDWLVKTITDLLHGKSVMDADEAISFSLTVQAKARGEL